MIDMDNKKTEHDSNGFVAINEDYFINEKIFLEIESYFKKKFLKFDNKIKETLLNAGFKNLEITPPRKSGYSYLQNTKNFKNCFDATRPHMSLYVECNK